MPILNKSKTFMVLALGYCRDNATTWNDEKFQGIIVVDMRRKKCFQSREKEQFKQSFKTVLFLSDNELLCQDRHGVHKLTISADLVTVPRVRPSFNSFASGQDSDEYEDDSDVHDVQATPAFAAEQKPTMQYDITVESTPIIKCTRGSRQMFAVRQNKILVLSGVTTQAVSTAEMLPSEPYERVETQANFFPTETAPRKRHFLQSYSYHTNRLVQMMGKHFEDILMQEAARNGEEAARIMRGKIQDAPKLKCDELAELEYPVNHDRDNSKFDRWAACMSPDETRVYVLFSN